MKPVNELIEIHDQYLICNGRNYIYADFESVHLEEEKDTGSSKEITEKLADAAIQRF
jgi:hypothetical protein